MRRRGPRRAVAIVTAVQLALSVGLSSVFVVCSSADGHVAVESTLAGDCCANHAAAGSGAEATPPDCGGCTDTPLVEARAVQRNEATDAHTVASLVPIPWAAPSPRMAATPRPGGTSVTLPPPATPALAARRFVVIRA